MLVIVDLETKSILHKFDEGRDVVAIAWSKDGRFLAYAMENGEIKIRETGSFDVVDIYQGHTGRVLAIDWSPDGKRLASGGLDKALRLWDTSNGKNVIVLKQKNGINAVKWSPQGQRLATLNLGGYTTVYDATMGYRAEPNQPR